jgi:hypothetical protein
MACFLHVLKLCVLISRIPFAVREFPSSLAPAPASFSFRFPHAIRTAKMTVCLGSANQGPSGVRQEADAQSEDGRAPLRFESWPPMRSCPGSTQPKLWSRRMGLLSALAFRAGLSQRYLLDGSLSTWLPLPLEALFLSSPFLPNVWH